MGHLPSNNVVDRLDLLMSFVEEKLCWKILWWLNRDKVQGGDAGLPADRAALTCHAQFTHGECAHSATCAHPIKRSRGN